METKLEHIIEQMAKERADHIDREFFKLLREQNVTQSKNIVEIRRALKKKNLTVVTELEEIDGAELLTTKLCRVIAEKRLKILEPKITIE